VALLRAQGQVVEIGTDELAMSQQESQALLEGASSQPADVDISGLVERTEGWPSGCTWPRWR
jgi:ATP/maltotriose-dependent transcriptional regulator MalT